MYILLSINAFEKLKRVTSLIFILYSRNFLYYFIFYHSVGLSFHFVSLPDSLRHLFQLFFG